ncbi:MAG: hypothetical protein KDB22_06760, partial [Planctomycetales bacterium]|nr:hypothetical protein [Planctomycetales bacterium]
REGYIPQSPKVRFLGTVHPFGEYLLSILRKCFELPIPHILPEPSKHFPSTTSGVAQPFVSILPAVFVLSLQDERAFSEGQ